ncbi:MAG: hypothetical protein JKY30_09545 [Flavobacteriales bacterium]|nr:hypothetical protein [Flavobacteriales bacterium]
MRVNPAAALGSFKKKGDKKNKGERKKAIAAAKTKKTAAIKRLKEGTSKKGGTSKKDKTDAGIKGPLASLGSGYGLHNFASESRPTQIVDYNAISTTLSLGLMATAGPVQIGPSADVFGTYSRQKNVETSNLNTYGYMYSANAGGGDMMDYFVEKGSTYTKQDKFLGIPFNNSDSYSLTGEGLAGGFKLHNKKVGTFHPNQNISVTNIINAGAEFEAGLNWGGGGDIGVGHQELKVGAWDALSSNGFSKDQDESNFFRFSNDMGGYLSYDGGNTTAKQANIQMSGWVPGAKSANANTSHITKNLYADSATGRSLRSSYIGYNTNSDMTTVQEGSINYKAYAKNTNAHLSNRITKRSNGSQIGEFSVVNEDGARYNYGIPVLSKLEKNLQVDLNGLSSGQIENRFIAYRDITGSTETKVGEIRDSSYATSYLLTGITSPDYIDRSNNGPTDDDFGGYTKFSYYKAYGEGVNNWYKWRMPYAGLSYSRNELSNPNDDLGSVAEGYKEMYYLETVETKTHYAVFYTSERRDGFDADHDEATASTTANAQGDLSLKKLDKIELFAKSPTGLDDELIKTVHFEYNYSLCQGVLNNDGGFYDGNGDGNDDNVGGGKLTLKKVWFEYNGVVEARISPYQFEYEYPQSANSALPNYVDYPARYDGYENFGNGLNENPDYSSFNIDAWGNFQINGATRYQEMRPWLDQSGLNMATFDPAAWQLKVIKLPSGGEIHVQYEQDDYCYVQDKQVHAMVSLKSSNHADGFFTLNSSELGITTNPEAEKLAAIIRKEYAFGKKRIYFKMLYKLIGNAIPSLTDCNAEYVTGYANVTSVTVSGVDIQIELSTGGYALPKDVCIDYVKTQRAGKLSIVGSNCDPSGGATIGGGNPVQKVLSFIGQAATWLASLAPGTTCLEINDNYSYLKVPMLYAKKGGGVRVKRLLMYDKGIDAGVPVLYGSEYMYKTLNDEGSRYISSGVATNEPGSIREENALIGFMDRFKQSFFSKVVSGRDKKQSEGPIGESLLPGASVGYSKIITKSIHSGKTNPGFAIKEYYTAKDFPIKIGMAEKDNNNVMTEMDRSKDYLPLITGLVNKITNNLWVSQGYAFEINSMHGQLRSSSTYAGNYADVLNPNASTLVSQEVMTYFEPGEELPILDLNDLSHNSTMPLGKEMDMVFESKYVKDISTDGNIEVDTDLGIFGIVVLPFLSAFPTMTFTETELYTHTTTKVTSYPAILKSTTSYADGIYHISENIAFNPETGKPIKVRTTDGYENLNLLASANHDGDYTKYTFPASMEYKNVSQKAKNERKILDGVTGAVSINKVIEIGKAFLSFSAVPPASVCSAMSNFVGGDLIKLSSGGVYHTGDIVGSKIEIQPTNYSSLGTATSNGIFVEIVRSGRTNQLNSAVGSLTIYGESDIVITPVDTSILGPRQRFAELLTTALTNTDTLNPDTIFTWDIEPGIEFVNADGSCSALDSSCYILIEGNQVNIYGPGIPFNQDTVIVGTPSIPHPMVDTLNHYLTTFYNYELDTVGGGFAVACGDVQFQDQSVIEISNSSYLNMRLEEDLMLSRIFSAVNGGTHAIDELMEVVDSGYTNATVKYSPTRLVNKDVVLEEIMTGRILGASLSCKSGTVAQASSSYYCNGCQLGESAVGACSTKDDVGIGSFEETSDGYLVYRAGTENNFCETDVRFYQLENGTAFPELKCSSTIIFSGGFGYFDIDPKTAALAYFAEDNDCYSQGIPCLRFCSESYPSTAISNVVASEANTLNDHWDYDESLYSAIGNDYEQGKRGKWRTKRTYAFKTDVDRLSTNFDKTYNSGTYNLELFNWGNLSANGHKWLELNTVQQYSPNGNALEEQNILGINSAAKFGYDKTLPYLIAQNAAYSSIVFESFENDYGTLSSTAVVEENVEIDDLDGVINTLESHSGKSSLKLKFPANKGIEMAQMTINSQILAKGLLFKTWIKQTLMIERL